MIRFVKHQEIDPEKWDKTVLGATQPTALATYACLDILADNAWNALVEDDYQCVMPLPYRSKLGFSYIFTPFFLPHLGPFSQTKTEQKKILDFFNHIPAKYIQQDLILNREILSFLPDNEVFAMTSYELDISLPHQTLFNDFSQNTRRNIAAAEKHLLTVELNDQSLSDIVCLFRNNKGKNKEVRFQEKDYRTLICLAEWLLKEDKLDVVECLKQDGTLIAGALMVKDVNNCRFWFSGRDNTESECKPMFYLINEYLKHIAGKPGVFDFNGSMNENVARMYKGFGGKAYGFPLYRHSHPAIKHLLALPRKIKL